MTSHYDQGITDLIDHDEDLEREAQEAEAAFYADHTYRLENRAGCFFEVIDDLSGGPTVWIRSTLTPDGERRTRTWARNHWQDLLNIGWCATGLPYYSDAASH